MVGNAEDVAGRTSLAGASKRTRLESQSSLFDP